MFVEALNRGSNIVTATQFLGITRHALKRRITKLDIVVPGARSTARRPRRLRGRAGAAGSGPGCRAGALDITRLHRRNCRSSCLHDRPNQPFTWGFSVTRLEDLKVGARVRGLSPTGVAIVKAVEWFGDQGVQVLYLDDRGTPQQSLLYRDNESRLALDAASAPWSFDADGDLLRLPDHSGPYPRRVGDPATGGRCANRKCKVLRSLLERTMKRRPPWVQQLIFAERPAGPYPPGGGEPDRGGRACGAAAGAGSWRVPGQRGEAAGQAAPQRM